MAELARLPARVLQEAARCPGCGSDRHAAISARSVSAGSRGCLVGLLEVGDRLEYHHCAGCGLVFLRQRYSDATLHQYYAEVCTANYEAETPADRLTNPAFSARDHARFTRVFDRVRRYAKDVSLVADIGGLDGRALVPFLSAGFDGVLVDPGDAEPVAGIRERFSDLEELVSSRGVPDVVLCLQTLEHLQSPSDFMTHLADTVADGALVYLEVPYDLLFMRDALASRTELQGDFHPEHLNFFSVESLTTLVATHGFVPVFRRATVQIGRFGGLMPSVTVVAVRGSSPRPPSGPASMTQLLRELTRDAARLRVIAKLNDVAGRLKGYGGYEIAGSPSGPRIDPI